MLKKIAIAAILLVLFLFPHSSKAEQTIAPLTPANPCVTYSGIVVAVTPDAISVGTSGSILLKNEQEGEIVFHYSKDTQFKTSINQIKPNNHLQITYNGVLTRSLPPQANALIIEKITPSQTYRGIITKISTKKGQSILTLKRASGTTSTPKTLQVKLNPSAKKAFVKQKFKKGSSVEVTYTASSAKIKTATKIKKYTTTSQK